MISKRLKTIGPHLVAFLQLAAGCLVLWPFMDFQQIDSITTLQWQYLVLIGIVHTCFKYMLMYSAVQRLKTPMIAVMGFIYPAVAILVDYMAYGGLVCYPKHWHWVDCGRRICDQHEPSLPVYSQKRKDSAA
jgi:drug/metabolite transporter (DMT)-like permease